MKKFYKILLIATILIICLIVVFYFISIPFSNNIIDRYHANQSTVIKDRNDQIIKIIQNDQEYTAIYLDNIPENFKDLLLQKEDKYFYYHPGINPGSSLRAVFNYFKNQSLASSTLTQQLTKVLLGQERERNLKNKIIESFHALALESHYSKNEIFKMYLNSVYFGNQIQGLKTAGKYYFNKTPEELENPEIFQLLATISNPSGNNPFITTNKSTAIELAKLQNIEIELEEFSLETIAQKKQDFNQYIKNDNYFEISSFNLDCFKECNLSIDHGLSQKLREIMYQSLLEIENQNTTNGSIVVIKVPENEILSIIGSPNPQEDVFGYQINMALKPRPIGSTIKPYIYLKGFENNLRPYTLVNDREYKYIIHDGYAFYPKNYDYQYRGIVNLHYALSNSLNVPTVKVLEYVGIENFNNFLTQELELIPVQPIENYQLGIALGGLEMDLLSLSYYFTVFANNGYLKPLKLYNQTFDFKTTTGFLQNKQISQPQYIQLVNKILTDRITGIEQFGIKSNLNLLKDNYAVKTGTSREYHDSWTIGYTPDFLIGVWVGNAQDLPMDQISGSVGAGKIWNQAMNLLYNSEYNNDTEFDFDLLEEYQDRGNLIYGFKNDKFIEYKNLLLEKQLILMPHNNDAFLFEDNTQIPLKASQECQWYINDQFLTNSNQTVWQPQEPGSYTIKCQAQENTEEITLYLNQEE